MPSPADVTALVEEYCALFSGLGDRSSESIEDVLVHESEWTPEAAEHLLLLASAYGSFMLRNALAISLALSIEDGQLGF